METDRKGNRQERLMEQLAAQRYISIEDIARRFSVTTQTARRDIMDLERQGKVRRLHGGAMLANSVDPGELRRRRVTNSLAKDRIGARVADLVEDGASVFLDTGTTCEAVARALVQRKNLRVVSYSLRIAAFLREVTDFTIAIPGGFVRQVDGGVFQEQARSFISGFKFDLAILSVSGIDDEGDLGDDDEAEVESVRTAMQHSSRVLLAVDGSKFGHRGLVRLGRIDDVDTIVTDRRPPPGIATLVEQAGVDLHLG